MLPDLMFSQHSQLHRERIARAHVERLLRRSRRHRSEPGRAAQILPFGPRLEPASQVTKLAS